MIKIFITFPVSKREVRKRLGVIHTKQMYVLPQFERERTSGCSIYQCFVDYNSQNFERSGDQLIDILLAIPEEENAAIIVVVHKNSREQFFEFLKCDVPYMEHITSVVDIQPNTEITQKTCFIFQSSINTTILFEKKITKAPLQSAYPTDPIKRIPQIIGMIPRMPNNLN